MKPLLTTVLFTLLLHAPLNANAWKVTVTNTLGVKLTVQVYYGVCILMLTNPHIEKSMEPYTTHTFDTGADCPRGVVSPDVHVNVMGTDMYGTWYGPAWGVCWAAVACADINMKTCDMPKGSSEQYSFCRE